MWSNDVCVCSGSENDAEESILTQAACRVFGAHSDILTAVNVISPVLFFDRYVVGADDTGQYLHKPARTTIWH